MIPMHYFSRYTLDRFLDRARAELDGGDGEFPRVMSKTTLPADAESHGAARDAEAARVRRSEPKEAEHR